MNVRRILMLMFVVMVMVQGASAATYTASMNSQPPSGSKCDEFNDEYNYVPSTPGLTSPKTIQWSGYPDTGNGYGVEWSGGTFGSSSGTMVTNSSVSWIWAYGNCPGNQWGAPGGSWITVTDVVINTASGSSCLDGVFDTYLVETYGNTLINTTNNSYSFDIIEGLEYSIYFDTTDEWYNFTASSSDETWNPSCPGTSTVSGTLQGPDGEGTNNALMALMYVSPPDPDNITAANTEASYSSSTGEYSFSNIYPGAYFVVACGPGPCYPYGSDWFYVTDSDVTVTDLTYPEKINIRFRVLDSNSTPQSGLYLHLQDAPSDYGGWISTDADGYTSYNPMYPSPIYVEIIDEDVTTLATTTITGDAQYEYQVSTITLPAPDANNTTIPVIPPDSNNSTPPTQPPAGGGDIGGGTVTDPGDYACTNTLTASVQDTDHSPITGAAVKLYPYNSSISGYHSGTTDAAGEYTFPCTNATLSYNVEARATCYEHEIAEDEGYSGTAYFHLNKTLTLACGFDDGSSGGGTGTNGTDGGDPDLIAESTLSDDTMKAPILNYLWAGFLLVIFYMVATFYKRK